MTDYAIVVLMGIDGKGELQELSVECEDLAAVMKRLNEAIWQANDWRAITILHIEDFASFMEGAKLKGGMTWDDD